MALGDGQLWNESLPDNDTVGHQIDDHNRDLRVGVRSRMSREHVWAASQTATNQGGHHEFVTFQAQTAAPTMAGTTAGGVWVGTDLAYYFTNSAAADIVIVGSGATRVAAVSGGTQGSIPVCSSASPTTLTVLAASAPDLYLKTNTNTGAPSWGNPVTDHFAVGSGLVAHAATVPLLSGYASNQVTCFVSIYKLTGTTVAIYEMTCGVDASRTVTCTGRTKNWVDGETYANIAGTANYLILGTK